MLQKTNLNISPYYDDFNKDKNFYKVLFKPAYPVQARELTGLQSLLQKIKSSHLENIYLKKDQWSYLVVLSMILLIFLQK